MTNQIDKLKKLKSKKDGTSFKQETKKKGQSGQMRVTAFQNEESPEAYSPDEKGKPAEKRRKNYASSILKSPGRTDEKLEEYKVEQ